MSGTIKLTTSTYLPKWHENDFPGKENGVYVQVNDERSTIAGHSVRTFEECWPHLNSRDVWENSELFKTMRDEAIADRQRKIDELK